MTKYGAKKVVIDGITFDSKVEGDYYRYLKTQKNIVKITCHPKYILQDKFTCFFSGEKIRAIYYVGDFEVEFETGNLHCIDIKGMATPEAKLKRKLFIRKYPHIMLSRTVRYKGEWVDYFANEKRKKKSKK